MVRDLNYSPIDRRARPHAKTGLDGQTDLMCWGTSGEPTRVLRLRVICDS